MSSRRRRYDPDPEFDFEAAAEAKEHAMLRVEAHADPDWKGDAHLAILDVAAVGQSPGDPFTTDDVWYLLIQRGTKMPHEKRALGPLMKRAWKEGFIVPLPRQEASVMRVCHGRRKQVWRRA